MTASAASTDPRRYFEAVDGRRTETAEALPVCLYLEVTNRCNLLCETCPRTFETLEPPADMSLVYFWAIVTLAAPPWGPTTLKRNSAPALLTA